MLLILAAASTTFFGNTHCGKESVYSNGGCTDYLKEWYYHCSGTSTAPHRCSSTTVDETERPSCRITQLPDGRWRIEANDTDCIVEFSPREPAVIQP